MSALPYEGATSGEKAITEAQKILAAFGCQSFGTMTDMERSMMIVQFKWRDRTISLEASWKGYAAAWMKKHPYSYQMKRTRPQHDQKALDQGKIAVCSVLRDWIKGQMTAVECGIMSFDAVFMPHMLLPTGERVIDRIKADGLLPPPAESNVLQIAKS